MKSSVVVNISAQGGIGSRRDRCAIGYAGTGDGFILRSGESGNAVQAANTALSQRVVHGESCGRRERWEAIALSHQIKRSNKRRRS